MYVPPDQRQKYSHSTPSDILTKNTKLESNYEEHQVNSSWQIFHKILGFDLNSIEVMRLKETPNNCPREKPNDTW